MFLHYKFQFTQTSDSASRSPTGVPYIQISSIRFYDTSEKRIRPKSVSNPSGGSPKAEKPRRLLDDDLTSKWLDWNFKERKESVLRFEFAEPFLLGKYEIFTANDCPGRDPDSWILSASSDQKSWTQIDLRVHVEPNPARHALLGKFVVPKSSAMKIKAEDKEHDFSGKYFKFTFSDTAAKSSYIQISLITFKSEDADVCPIDCQNPQGESPSGEHPRRLLEHSLLTKWLDWHFKKHGYSILVFAFERDISLASYTIFTANDCPERDPTGWKLEVSKDNKTWKHLDSRKISASADRFSKLGSFSIVSTRKVALAVSPPVPVKHKMEEKELVKELKTDSLISKTLLSRHEVKSSTPPMKTVAKKMRLEDILSKVPIIESSEITDRKLIGLGGSKQVFKAKYREKIVAFKFFEDLESDFVDDEIRLRINKEAACIFALSHHPNVAKLIGRTTEGHFVCELCRGTLRQAIELMKPKPDLKKRINWFLELLGIIEFLHIEGICHGDIKPENLLITKDEKSGEDVIMIDDFGSAANSRKTSTTITGKMGGTPGYRAPETFQKKAVYRSFKMEQRDVYSLGCVFVFMMSERHPWSDDIDLLESKMKDIWISKKDLIPEEEWNLCEEYIKSDVEFGNVGLEVLDAIRECFITDPGKRITLPVLKKKCLDIILSKSAGTSMGMSPTLSAEEMKAFLVEHFGDQKDLLLEVLRNIAVS